MVPPPYQRYRMLNYLAAVLLLTRWGSKSLMSCSAFRPLGSTNKANTATTRPMAKLASNPGTGFVTPAHLRNPNTVINTLKDAKAEGRIAR